MVKTTAARPGCALVASSLCLLAFCCCGLAAEISAPEPQAKAAFLFGFAKYVEWPTNAFGPGRRPIVIGVIGDDDITRELTAIARGKSIGSRPVEVFRGPFSEVNRCHVVLLSSSQKWSTTALLRAVQDSPTLTVADFDSFLDAGGMISLNTRGTRIQFHVNLPAAQKAGLALNAKLLALAESVRGKPGK